MLVLKCCKCFRLRCPFQDLNEPGGFCAWSSAPFVPRGLQRRSQGEALGRAGWAGSLGGVGGSCIPRLQMPSATPPHPPRQRADCAGASWG